MLPLSCHISPVTITFLKELKSRPSLRVTLLPSAAQLEKLEGTSYCWDLPFRERISSALSHCCELSGTLRGSDFKLWGSQKPILVSFLKLELSRRASLTPASLWPPVVPLGFLVLELDRYSAQCGRQTVFQNNRRPSYRSGQWPREPLWKPLFLLDYMMCFYRSLK